VCYSNHHMVSQVGERRVYKSSLRQEQAQVTRRRILDAARRLFADRGYRAVTVEDIAAEAKVAYQTVYAVFGTKLAMARDILWSSFDTEGIDQLMAQASTVNDLECHLGAGAHIARKLNERFAPIVQFMRESGDPALLAEYQKVEDLRFAQIRSQVSSQLRNNPRLRKNVSPADALASIWALTGTDLYHQLVASRRWTASRYETWLKDALIKTLLDVPARTTTRRSTR
jgi:AcrR family transcriptional regulator